MRSRAVGAVLLTFALVACTHDEPTAAVTTTATTATTTVTAAVSPWPAAMHDARHSGQSTAVGPRRGDERWRRELGGNVTPGPVIEIDGSVVVATNAGVLFALDPADGARRWTFDARASYGNDLSTSPTVLADATIAWPGPSGRLNGVGPDGRLRWQVDLEGFVLSPAVSATGRIYIVTMSGITSAIDIATDGATATVAWSVDTGGGSYGSPALAPDGTLITTSSTEVVAVTDHGRSSSVRWRRRLDAQIEVAPAVGPDGTIVVGDNGRREFGLDPADGHVRWTAMRGDETSAPPVVTPDRRAYFADHTATLYLVDAHNGVTIRTTTTRAERAGRSYGVWTAPAVDATGAAYYGTRSGHVFGVDPDGTQMFDIDLDGTIDSYPAIGGDGTLYSRLLDRNDPRDRSCHEQRRRGVNDLRVDSRAYSARIERLRLRR